MSQVRRRIEPLAQRLPSLLAYPASRTMLWIMAALCFVRMLNHLPSLLGLLFEGVFWVMGFKLAVEALVNTVQGRFEPLGGDDLMATDANAMQQILLQLVVLLPIYAVAAWFGAVPALVMLGLAVVFLPAAIILLTMDDSLPRALNPLAWGALIGRLGGSYFTVVVILAVLMGVSIVAQWIFVAALPADMGMLPASFISLYALVASYHVLGYLIHEHQDALGLDVASAVPRAAFANAFEDEAMADAEALVKQDQLPAAADRLQELFRGRGASDAVHDRYHQLLAAIGDKPRLLAHARDYVCSLLATGKDKRALGVVSETLALAPEYRHDVPGDVARLVAQAGKTGQSQLAVSLAEDFESRFPGDENTPQVVLAVAEVMAEKFAREDAGYVRLSACLAKFRTHPLAGDMADSLARIERLRTIARGARAG